jgi:hypothetical protein
MRCKAQACGSDEETTPPGSARPGSGCGTRNLQSTICDETGPTPAQLVSRNHRIVDARFSGQKCKQFDS